MPEPDSQDINEMDTLEESFRSFAGQYPLSATILSLGIIWHPNTERIGAIATLNFDQTGEVELSRLTPEFCDIRDGEKSPLLDQHLSRTPIVIRRLDDRQFSFTPSKRTNVLINGKKVIDNVVVDMDELGDEIIVTLGNSIVLALFNAPARKINPYKDEISDLIGISNGLAAAKNIIERVSNSDMAVLIRGETGTGKELVAQAIHRLSKRKNKKLISTNMAAIAPTLAASELFGVKKGAFTGATHDKHGLFQQASDGTLFLDEIGDTPREVQPMLLRTLEFGEVKSIGDTKTDQVNVRIIAATDRTLESIEGEPSFNQPLLQRLQGIVVEIPPLRLRRVDIGLLIKLFWQSSSAETRSHMHLDAKHVTHMTMYDWPGNVRELRNKVSQIQLGGSVFEIIARSEPRSHDTSVLVTQKSKKKSYRNSADISDKDLLDALDSTNWIIKDAAKSLNISRTVFYDLMEKSPSIRNAEDINEQEIRDVIAEIPGGIDAWVKHLKVGRSALQKRIQNL